MVIIPLSLWVSDRVYDTYNASIEETITASEELSGTTSELSEAGEDRNLVSSILERLSTTGTELANKAARVVNRYVESLAVMIVTSCVIPILVLVFLLWLIKTLTGVAIPMSSLPVHRKK